MTRKEILKSLLITLPLFYPLPVPTKYNTIAEITENIQLYAWIMPYIVSCLPVKPLYEHLLTLPPLFNEVENEVEKEVGYEGSRMGGREGGVGKERSIGGTSFGTPPLSLPHQPRMTPSPDSSSSRSIPLSIDSGFMLYSWIYLGRVYTAIYCYTAHVV